MPYQFVKQCFQKLFGRHAPAVENEALPSFLASPLGPFCSLDDGRTYDHRRKLIKGVDDMHDGRMLTVQKHQMAPLECKMRFNLGKNGCIWVMSDGGSINMSSLRKNSDGAVDGTSPGIAAGASSHQPGTGAPSS